MYRSDNSLFVTLQALSRKLHSPPSHLGSSHFSEATQTPRLQHDAPSHTASSTTHFLYPQHPTTLPNSTLRSNSSSSLPPHSSYASKALSKLTFYTPKHQILVNRDQLLLLLPHLERQTIKMRYVSIILSSLVSHSTMN